MQIRIATPQDALSMLEILNQAIVERRNAYLRPLTVQEGEPWFQSLHANARCLVVVEHQEDIAAWGSLTPYRSGRGALSGVAEITFYVHEDHRGIGIGVKLTEHLEREAKSLGVHHLVAILLADNLPSIRLLSKFGYAEWARFEKIVQFDDAQMDHLYMGKAL